MFGLIANYTEVHQMIGTYLEIPTATSGQFPTRQAGRLIDVLEMFIGSSCQYLLQIKQKCKFDLLKLINQNRRGATGGGAGGAIAP